jgi:serine/threonine protein kinase/Tol biopolymer transport system component
MTPERWTRTEELYHAALARPLPARAAFLAAACGDDDDLRLEVESLLDESAGDGSLLDDPLVVPVDVIPPGAMTGRRLGGYHLEALLGAGGMGEVYRAHDARLERAVAVKILPPAFTSDPDRLARFAREARILAAVNHPNICAIHSLEEVDGMQLLVLELVDGDTLAVRIRQRAASAPRSPGLPMAHVLTMTRQIAEALEAAHDKGIVHRDLKPANIAITREGAVKVLDFGLAKVVGDERPDSDLSGASLTVGGLGPGAVLGTAAYMSPEQARGLTLDKRTDIWALGCVLYEMLSGQPAFAGATASDTIARILEREPNWTAIPPATPASIRRLLARCLVKDPRQRLRDAGEIRIALVAEDDGRPAKSPSLPRPGPPLASLLAWAGMAALIFGLSLWRGPAPTPEVGNPLADATFTLLTNWPGAEEGAEISPDGQFVAFLSDHDGEFDIWLNQIGTGRSTNLTREFPALAASGVIVRKLGFSGDGTEIWFNPEARRPLLLLPLTGGKPRAFLGEGANTPAWSPEGSRLVYFTKPPDGADPLYLADRTGADPRQILSPQANLHGNNPVWSADGEWIYFVMGTDPQDEVDVNVWRLRAAGGPPERLTDLHAAASFLAPIDPRTLLYIARAEDGTGPWLWALDVDARSTRRVSSGLDRFTSVASSRDGRRLVATVANPTASLWQVALSDPTSSELEAEPYSLPLPTGRARSPRFGGTSLFFLSSRGAGDGLWRVDGGQASLVWRDVDAALSEPPAVSRDGRFVAVVVRRDGKRHLMTMSADGGSPRTLAPAIDVHGAAGQGTVDWSPDGRWIVTGGEDAQGPALFKIPVDGGAPIRLVEGKWGNPIWSPDGSRIVYAGRSLVGVVALHAVRPDGVAADLPAVRARPGGYRFTADGTGLVYLPGIHAQNFWRLDLATETSAQITNLASYGSLSTFDITPDGRHIVFDRSHENSNVVLIERPRP